ncbi:protein kinase domain-containing protein [Pendulispora albinea]|uniref:Protein kinase n=1 Tax=Pendulispora albinea TaxID=2741071 RepID=A0ABZ2LPE5_9BACT
MKEANRPPLPPEVARLLEVGRPGGPSIDDAMALLRQIRRTPHEARTLEELTIRHTASPLPEPLALAAASAAIDRGEPAAAFALLNEASSSGALMLRADLEADRGDTSAALALVERVLLRDIGHPGARERHLRLRQAMGLTSALDGGPGGWRGAQGARKERDARETTWIASEPDTPYVIHREVARGGSGVVYEAEDRDLGRRLALKMYHEPNRQREQLLHEARVAVALSGLAGPGIVRVFDVDPDRGWIALEWAGGGALRDRIGEGDRAALLPIERWALPLAATLARVHDAGWLHLDVKPANVLFARDNAPLLTDFGIARRQGEHPAAGSLGYASPERIAGAACDEREDVYGFGRLLEDVIQRLNTPDIVAQWTPLVSACVAPRMSRLSSAHAIAQRISEALAR